MKYLAILHLILVVFNLVFNLVMAVSALQDGNMFGFLYLAAAFMWGVVAYFNWNNKS